jgi:anti-anti-sigma regulatory factor
MAVLAEFSAVGSRPRGPRTRLSRARGEHDIATTWLVADALVRAIALDDADLVVDLSEVKFIGADTIGTLLRARASLLAGSRSLVMRAPGRCARRVMDILEVGEHSGRWVEGQVARPAPQPA